jgi:Alpha/beta hydrolase domain
MRRALLSCVSALVLAPAAEARVVEWEVLRREPTFEGRSFGNVGPYEKVLARAKMAVRPEDAHNAGIVDLGLAPRNGAGEVEFTTQVYLLKPTDLSRGNGRLLYDVLNRGRKLGLELLNDAPASNDPTSAAEAGNGFLMERGYTVAWSGWQGDLATANNLIGLAVPTLSGVTGTSRDEFVFDDLKNPATADLAYPAADLDPSRATLTVRAREGDARATPAGLSFKYLSPTKLEITRPAGYDAGAIYEFIYPAKEPKVLGLGFAATRDVVSFLRHEPSAPNGAANPLASTGQLLMRHAYALGISQSGRFLRDLVYQDFNEDEAGRRVFDGVVPHIAGSRKTFVNARFAQPGRYSRDHEDHLYPGDQFPFTYGTSTDPLSGETDGILKRCSAAASGCPNVMHTDTDTENLQARISLVTTDPSGKPLDLPANVRAYFLAGLPHFSPATAKSAPTPTCQLPSNPLHAGPAMRALLVALDRWVGEGLEPPASRYPNARDGSLVAPKEAGYAGLPGLTFRGEYNEKPFVDHATAPPKAGPEYPVSLARVDGDGHAVAAVRLPAVEVPTATYLGWNLRKSGFGEGALCGLTGSTIPLARTRAEREAFGDRRPSLEERYPTKTAYVAAVRSAAERLVGDSLLLPADAERLVREAETSSVLGRP